MPAMNMDIDRIVAMCHRLRTRYCASDIVEAYKEVSKRLLHCLNMAFLCL
jgi:hypothetical protein